MERLEKHCSNCTTKYKVEWNSDEQDLKPLTCPFCGFEVDDDDDGSDQMKVIDDYWN